MELTKGLLAFFLAFVIFPLGAQTAPQSRILAADLEKLVQESKTPAKRGESLKTLARLHQLSGNREQALDAWLSAAYTVGSSIDYNALLEACRLLISLGEYERADVELRKIPPEYGETALEARMLMAGVWAFSRGDTRYLVPLASDPLFIKWRQEIYFVLWKTSPAGSGADLWKDRLLAEYPQSPEARITGDAGNVSIAAVPLWLLSAGLGHPPAINQETPAQETQSSVTQARTGQHNIQAGLFGVENNARNEVLRLEKAGFSASLVLRKSNGRELWAVMVDSGRDSNSTLRALKNAGWPDAFPVNN